MVAQPVVTVWARGWVRCHGGVVADDRERGVGVTQDGVADRAEQRSHHGSSAAGSDHEQGGPAGLGDQRVGGIAAHERGVDRDVGERGLPAVQRALEGAARERLGRDRKGADRFDVGR